MIEFALVIGLLIMGMLGAISAAMWSVETMGAVTAAEQGARLSLGAAGTGTQSSQLDLTAVQRVIPQLQGTSFGTRVISVAADGNGDCPGARAVIASYGAHVLGVCAGQHPAKGVSVPPLPSELQNWQVSVRIAGCANLLVAMPYSFGNCPGGAIIDELAVMHPGVFQP